MHRPMITPDSTWTSFSDSFRVRLTIKRNSSMGLFREGIILHFHGIVIRCKYMTMNFVCSIVFSHQGRNHTFLPSFIASKLDEHTFHYIHCVCGLVCFHYTFSPPQVVVYFLNNNLASCCRNMFFFLFWVTVFIWLIFMYMLIGVYIINDTWIRWTKASISKRS